jgi:predicted metalloprotease with PDZ domain
VVRGRSLPESGARARPRARLRGSLAALAALSTLAAAACVHDPSAPGSGEPAYAYAIAPPPAGSWALHIDATFERAPAERLVAPEADEAIDSVELREGGGARALARTGDAWVAPECRDRCTVRYSVDLLRLAAACRRFDCSRRVGDAVIGSAVSWMLHPEPMGDAGVRVRVVGGDPSRIATGLRRAPDGGYVMRARELGEAAYTAFGAFRRARLDVGGSSLDLALLGPPLAMGDAAAAEWVRGAATRVASLYGRFPCDATVFVVPVRGADEIVFGRVLSLAGASVALLFGDEASPERAHQDWVAVHELFHLSTASFMGEGHWLEEGLATFYEPVLRERAGWMTEADLWSHFAASMPRGVRKEGEPASIEERDDIDSTYWGGALFVMLADLAVLESTKGARSLDDAMRAALQKDGDATHSSTVAEFLRTGDEATGTHALADTYASFAMAGGPVDLDGIWRRLGVEARSDGSVVLHDDAPMAFARKAIAGAGGGGAGAEH